jgi:hypothetical protein
MPDWSGWHTRGIAIALVRRRPVNGEANHAIDGWIDWDAKGSGFA